MKHLTGNLALQVVSASPRAKIVREPGPLLWLAEALEVCPPSIVARRLGCSEDWVMRRTGHTTSAQLHRYRIAAATAAEFGLGWLRDFDQVLAETADSLGAGNGPLSVKNTAKEAVAGGRLPTPGRETSPDTSPFSSEKDTSEEAEEGPQAHRGQGADRLSELIAAAIAEARSLGLVQVEIRLRNALTASSKRRAS